MHVEAWFEIGSWLSSYLGMLVRDIDGVSWMFLDNVLWILCVCVFRPRSIHYKRESICKIRGIDYSLKLRIPLAIMFALLHVS